MAQAQDSQTLNPQPILRHLNENSGYRGGKQLMDVNTDSEGNVWGVSFGNITRYNGTKFTEINTSTASHHNFLRFHEGLNGQKFVIDMGGNIFFIEADTIRAFPLNDTLRGLNKFKAFSDVYIDKNHQLHVSYSGSGYSVITPQGEVKRVLQSRKNRRQYYSYNAIPASRDRHFISTEPRGDIPKSKPKYFKLLDEEFNIIDSVVLPKHKYFMPESSVLLPNGNQLFSNGRGQLIEFNDSLIVKSIDYNFPVIKLFVDSKGGLWV